MAEVRDSMDRWRERLARAGAAGVASSGAGAGAAAGSGPAESGAAGSGGDD
jgi:hypothetical protein